MVRIREHSLLKNTHSDMHIKRGHASRHDERHPRLNLALERNEVIKLCLPARYY
jgi:hypothetical protein